MMESVRIRPAVEADADSVSELIRQVEALHAKLLPRYFRVAKKPTAAPKSTDAHAVLVAETVVAKSELVVGFVSLQLFETPPTPTLVPRLRVHIDELVVAEPFRRRGVGRRLLDAACEWAHAKGADEVLLTVWEGNRAAEKFYRKMGFGVVNQVRGKGL